MSVITMSTQELSRLQVIHDVLHKRLKQKDGAQILGICTRQIQRLISAYTANGPEGLVSAKRGKPSNHRHPEHFREYAMHLVSQHGRMG